MTGHHWTLYEGMTRIMENAFLNVKNRSHSITADLEIPAGGGEGVIICQGGKFRRLELLHEGRQALLRSQLGRPGHLHRYEPQGPLAWPGQRPIRVRIRGR